MRADHADVRGLPCCGHERGCCPRYDAETGKQLDSRYSLCASCLSSAAADDGGFDEDYDHEESWADEMEALR
jgi:hypothetical protein